MAALTGSGKSGQRSTTSAKLGSNEGGLSRMATFLERARADSRIARGSLELFESRVAHFDASPCDTVLCFAGFFVFSVDDALHPIR